MPGRARAAGGASRPPGQAPVTPTLAGLGIPPAGPLLAAPAGRPNLHALVLVLLAAALATVLASLHRRVRLPTVVVEIVLGIIIGPRVLGIADVNPYITILADFGLGFLFFVAGIEVIAMRVERRLLGRGTVAWGIVLATALAVGFGLEQAGLDARWWLVGVALSTTALGALVPILSDAGLLSTPMGSAVLGSGIAGEFWPVVVISVFLTGAYGAAREVVLLVAFGLLVLITAVVVLSTRPPAIVRILQETVHTSGQAAVRGSLFVLAALVFLATNAGFDFVLGAFAAGLVIGLVLDSPEGEEVRLRLDGIGFGFLIPIYFVVTGMSFDLDSLLSPTGLGLAGLFLAIFLALHVLPALLWRGRLDRRELTGLVLCSATGLPLIAAIVGIGIDQGGISPSVGASLIGAGMVSVLVYPLLTTFLVPGAAAAADPRRAVAGDGPVRP
jgi:Kef-type K+ transport system membrane component KefB